MNQHSDKENISDGITDNTKNSILGKKENMFLLDVLVLSIVLFFIVSIIFQSNFCAATYFLSVISSVLLINGYNREKNSDK